MISEMISGIFKGAVQPILDKWVPDAKDRLAAEQLFFVQAQAINMAQISVNQEEAKSTDRFVSGWRPFIGWVCGAGFAYAVIVRDIMNWCFGVAAVYTGHDLPTLPNPDVTIMFEVLAGMLGLGGFRTYEKLKGVAK
jgi:hypothetical protein